MKETTLSHTQIELRQIISFTVFILAFAGAIFAWKKLRNEAKADNIPVTLRRGLEKDEKVFGGLFNKNRLVPTYTKAQAAKHVRVNGDLGLSDASADTATWRLRVVRKTGDTLILSLDDIKKLPKTEVIFDFKCIEGWSQKTWWGGVRFSDFASYYHLTDETQMSYAGLATPDKGYYVGIDMPSMEHPQTLLCYEMNGQPLPLNQGFPLRLIIPVKYGIKHLKRIGTLYFSNQKPPDYWAEQGYDYYSGH